MMLIVMITMMMKSSTINVTLGFVVGRNVRVQATTTSSTSSGSRTTLFHSTSSYPFVTADNFQVGWRKSFLGMSLIIQGI